MTKTQINKLDKIFGELIRSHGRCELCGETRTLQAAHLVSRKYHQTRWDLKNVYCLCAKCHRLVHDYPAAWEKIITSGDMAYLWTKANQIKKLFYEDVLKELDEVL